MIQRMPDLSTDLYVSDETAWLDVMSSLIKQERYDELDFENLGEYLADMARRDRREVESRMAVLIAHWLKWTFQAHRRCGSWRETIVVQRQELLGLLERGVLRNHALQFLDKVYARGVEQAAAETGLTTDSFPSDCPFAIDEWLTIEVLGEVT